MTPHSAARAPGRAHPSVLLLTVALVVIGAAPLFGDYIAEYRDRPDEWFQTPKGRRIVGSIISWQNPNGGWPRQYDVDRPRGEHDRGRYARTSSFDNHATHTELRLLARAHRVNGDLEARAAFRRGLQFVFEAQHDNGGWPQRYPLEDNYTRHITFNDGVMTGILNLLKDMSDGRADFEFVGEEERRRAGEALGRGLKCVLDCQIEVNGRLTGWCQQHHLQTLAPTGARSFELPAISGAESCDVVLMLMRIEEPDERVKRAIHSAVAWIDDSKLTGIRLEKRPDPATGEVDRIVVADPSAEPLWARFYQIEDNRPFFCGRDGVKKHSLAEIEAERRNHYAWLGNWGAAVLKRYPKWTSQHP